MLHIHKTINYFIHHHQFLQVSSYISQWVTKSTCKQLANQTMPMLLCKDTIQHAYRIHNTLPSKRGYKNKLYAFQLWPTKHIAIKPELELLNCVPQYLLLTDRCGWVISSTDSPAFQTVVPVPVSY